MKKLFTLILAGAVCLGAYAQESRILEDWEEKIEEQENEFLSSFSYLNFTYNHNLNAPEGYNASGWGIEWSMLHLGFNPWKNGRFTLGLFDMAFDFNYLQKGYSFARGMENNIVSQNVVVPAGTASRATRFAYKFPLGYIQRFGTSKGSAAILVSPGIGWDKYYNDITNNGIKEYQRYLVKGGAYFRLDLQAMVWFKNMGITARYSFPKDFKGPGVVSAGLSFRL